MDSVLIYNFILLIEGWTQYSCTILYFYYRDGLSTHVQFYTSNTGMDSVLMYNFILLILGWTQYSCTILYF